MSKFWSSCSSSSSSSSTTEGGGTCENGGFDDVWEDDDELEPNCNFRPARHAVGEHSFATEALAAIKDDPLDPNIVWARIKGEQIFQTPPTKSSEHKLDCARIVCMSDTHSKHFDVFLPKGDILIHGGDFTKSGEIGTVRDLSKYFGHHATDFEHIICIAGNHELTFQSEFYKTAKRRHKPQGFDPSETRAALKNCLYLEDTGLLVRDALEVFGSPWTPHYYDWAFNLPRGSALDQVWSHIPASTDILITHGPPLGRGDFTGHSGRTGCHDLLRHVQTRIRPRLHVFGHIHESYGTTFDGHTLFVNASNLDSETGEISPHRPCVVVDVPQDPSLPAQVVKPSCQIHTNDEFQQWLEQKRSYTCLLSAVEQVENLEQTFLLEEVFAKKSAFFTLCDVFQLHRNKQARKELQRALCQLYAESF